MTKQELTFEALPVEVRNSALTTKQMGVLNVLYRMSTMETSKANPDGSFFASQATLMNETGYSNNTIIDVRSNFDECGFITTQKGTWEGRMATTYILHKDVVMEWAKSHPRIGAVKQRRTKKGAVISAVNKCTDAVNKCTDDETQTLRDEVKRMGEALALANQRISALEKALNIGAVNGAVNGAVMDKCTTEPDSEKEPYHIQPYSNPIESNDYRADAGETDFNEIEGYTNDGEVNPSNADEVVPSNEGDQTGSVSDFQKIEGNDPDEVDKSQATANKASGSVATPQTIQTTTDNSKRDQNANKVANPVSGNTHLNAEERINQLDALQLWKMNTPNVNPIELAKEVGELLAHKDVLCQGNAYTKAAMVGCYLIMYANDDDTLNEIGDLLLAPHIARYKAGERLIEQGINDRRNELANPQTLETSPEAHLSHADHSDEETLTNDEKTRQKRPDEATEALEVFKSVDALLTKLANLDSKSVSGDHEAVQNAEKMMNKVCDQIGKAEKIEHLNWCKVSVPDMIEKHGRVLGTNASMYLTVIPKIIENRRNELLAA